MACYTRHISHLVPLTYYRKDISRQLIFLQPLLPPILFIVSQLNPKFLYLFLILYFKSPLLDLEHLVAEARFIEAFPVQKFTSESLYLLKKGPLCCYFTLFKGQLHHNYRSNSPKIPKFLEALQLF